MGTDLYHFVVSWTLLLDKSEILDLIFLKCVVINPSWGFIFLFALKDTKNEASVQPPFREMF